MQAEPIYIFHQQPVSEYASLRQAPAVCDALAKTANRCVVVRAGSGRFRQELIPRFFSSSLPFPSLPIIFSDSWASVGG